MASAFFRKRNVAKRKDPVIKKIASDVYDDWGLQAIHLVNVQSKGRKPIVAVIDSGGKLRMKTC